MSSCAGQNNPENSAAPAASVGDEPPPGTATTVVTREAVVAPAVAGRGRIVVESKIAGKVVPAHAKLLKGDRSIDFEAGEEISAEAGTQQIEVTLADASVLIDKPSMQLEVFVEPNKLAKVEAAFPWAKVQLDLILHGKKQPGTVIKLERQGNVVAEVKSGPPVFMISPGNYEAQVAVRGKPARVKGLAFFENSEQVVPVSVTH